MEKPQKIFSELYDQYVDKIYRFIFLKVSSQEVAQDLTSETFLRGWKVFRNPKDIENPPAFLYKIARNLVIDHYREKEQKSTISIEDLRIVDPRSNLEEKAILTSDLNTIKGALTNLKEDYQTVIIWHYLDDLSIPEIAKILEKPEGTIRVTLHRALKSLKNELS